MGLDHQLRTVGIISSKKGIVSPICKVSSHGGCAIVYRLVLLTAMNDAFILLASVRIFPSQCRLHHSLRLLLQLEIFKVEEMVEGSKLGNNLWLRMYEADE